MKREKFEACRMLSTLEANVGSVWSLNCTAGQRPISLWELQSEWKEKKILKERNKLARGRGENAARGIALI